MKLSVIIPCFNEFNTIDTIIKAVNDSPYKNKEIIIIDDFSTDGTRDKLKEIEKIEGKIAILKSEISEVPLLKELILKKYL